MSTRKLLAALLLAPAVAAANTFSISTPVGTWAGPITPSWDECTFDPGDNMQGCFYMTVEFKTGTAIAPLSGSDLTLVIYGVGGYNGNYNFSNCQDMSGYGKWICAAPDQIYNDGFENWPRIKGLPR